MKRDPMDCRGCFHSDGMICTADNPEACKANGYDGYRSRDFVHFVPLSEYVARNDIRCFFRNSILTPRSAGGNAAGADGVPEGFEEVEDDELPF